MENLVIGQGKSDNFRKEFRGNYITESDIQRIDGLGFNSFRPALNLRLFLTVEENPVYAEEGFQLHDIIII